MLSASGPAASPPGRPISGPEALLRNIEYHEIEIVHDAKRRHTNVGKEHKSPLALGNAGALRCAIVLPGRKSAFRARFWSDWYRENTEGQPGADVGAFPVAVRPKSGPEGRFTARKHYCVT